MTTLLEVIAITPEDARAAAEGGADRLEVVSEIGVGGLTPSLDQYRAIRTAVDLPLRVMLRTNEGFTISERELDILIDDATALLQAGADQFVFGFLDERNALDLGALEIIYTATSGCPWTLHHAFDHTADSSLAWATARELPNLDHVLSGGAIGDLGQGRQILCERAGWQDEDIRWLAGGGLVLDYVETLRAAGVRAFHIGRAARFEHSWNQPIDPAAVRRWREALDSVD